MKKHVGIGIPCKEDRTNMTPTEQGAFCSKCAMEVIDFTRMSTEEIKHILYANKGERVCASLTPALEDTLNRDFYAWQSSHKEHMQRAMIFSLFLIFGLTLFSCSSIEGNRALQQAHVLLQNQLELREYPKEEPPNIDPVTNSIEVAPPDSIEKSLEVPEIIPLPVEEPVGYDMMIDGGMRISEDYYDYLVDTIVDIELEEEVRVDAPIDFHAFAYPNPVVDRTTLSIELPEEVAFMEIQLLDMHGKILEHQKKTHVQSGTLKQVFLVDHLEPGMYILNVETHGVRKSIRFVKQ